MAGGINTMACPLVSASRERVGMWRLKRHVRCISWELLGRYVMYLVGCISRLESHLLLCMLNIEREGLSGQELEDRNYRIEQEWKFIEETFTEVYQWIIEKIDRAVRDGWWLSKLNHLANVLRGNMIGSESSLKLNGDEAFSLD